MIFLEALYNAYLFRADEKVRYDGMYGVHVAADGVMTATCGKRLFFCMPKGMPVKHLIKGDKGVILYPVSGRLRKPKTGDSVELSMETVTIEESTFNTQVFEACGLKWALCHDMTYPPVRNVANFKEIKFFPVNVKNWRSLMRERKNVPDLGTYKKVVIFADGHVWSAAMDQNGNIQSDKLVAKDIFLCQEDLPEVPWSLELWPYRADAPREFGLGLAGIGKSQALYFRNGKARVVVLSIKMEENS